MLQGLRGVHHIALAVPDLDQAEAFYVGVLGLTLVERFNIEPGPLADAVTGLQQAQARVLMLKANNIYLEIFEYTGTARPEELRPLDKAGYTHLAFDVAPDAITTVYTTLSNAGVQWQHPPTVVADGITMCYGRDPFGNVLELQSVAPGATSAFERL